LPAGFKRLFLNVGQGGTLTAKAEWGNAGQSARGDSHCQLQKKQNKKTWPVESALPGNVRITSMMRETLVSPAPSYCSDIPPRGLSRYRATSNDDERCCI